ncbi:AI-2E family transporter [Motiliproteus coralliicola]|uniref:AI-2E family transporter n=1 Tax=Motiliproteus coralliicola TaxID=2283196 RepID=A0A369WQA9_9GAMM|nr:AI-2E family transporter [Motiliproteus coralliicola]RDE22746.1 AI-2E family transporter [Motiliproteus coralliicola]
MTDSQRWLVLTLVLLCAGLFYLLEPILFPFLSGMLLAYMGDPLADRLEQKGLSRTLSVVIVFTGLSLLLVVSMLLLLPKLGQQIDNLVSQVPLFFDWIKQTLIPWLERVTGMPAPKLELDRLRQVLMQHWQTGGDLATQLLGQATRSGLAFVGWLVNLTLIPVVAFYLLRDWDAMVERIRLMLPRNIEPHVSRWASECDEVLGAFMKGQLLVMLCLGAFYALGLALVGLKLALILGLLAGLASIVPYMGFIVGIGASLIAAMLQFNELYYLALVGLVFGAGQLLEGMFLTPVLVGDKIGLHPVAVIFAIMAGGQLFGFTGVLLALPVAAVIMVLLRHLHAGYLDSDLYQANEGRALESGDDSSTDSPSTPQ